MRLGYDNKKSKTGFALSNSTISPRAQRTRCSETDESLKRDGDDEVSQENYVMKNSAQGSETAL